MLITKTIPKTCKYTKVYRAAIWPHEITDDEIPDDELSRYVAELPVDSFNDAACAEVRVPASVGNSDLHSRPGPPVCGMPQPTDLRVGRSHASQEVAILVRKKAVAEAIALANELCPTDILHDLVSQFEHIFDFTDAKRIEFEWLVASAPDPEPEPEIKTDVFVGVSSHCDDI
jgi:hypothetical protein